jgi:hypothetical protein
MATPSSLSLMTCMQFAVLTVVPVSVFVATVWRSNRSLWNELVARFREHREMAESSIFIIWMLFYMVIRATTNLVSLLLSGPQLEVMLLACLPSIFALFIYACLAKFLAALYLTSFQHGTPEGTNLTNRATILQLVICSMLVLLLVLDGFGIVAVLLYTLILVVLKVLSVVCIMYYGLLLYKNTAEKNPEFKKLLFRLQMLLGVASLGMTVSIVSDLVSISDYSLDPSIASLISYGCGEVIPFSCILFIIGKVGRRNAQRDGVMARLPLASQIRYSSIQSDGLSTA